MIDARSINILIPLFIGLGLLFAGLKFITKRKKLLTNGIEVEGVIFGFESSSGSTSGVAYPVIRFVTKEGLWITESANIGLPQFLLKQGQQVKVVYNPAKPKEFIYKTSVDFSKIGYFIVVGGILLFIAGIWFAYKYLTK
ncbi:MAG: hypothetical protein JWM28_986 [Chitinophagaceae bacterium]|nr:hypothetical protein [Chitinophagaceae bacterium]